MNRHPRAATRPPITAVTLVDFRKQHATVTGDIKRATAVERAPSHPRKIKKSIYVYKIS